jgi:hypothetical protein
MKETSVTGPLKDVTRTLRARVRGFFDAPIGGNAAPLELLQAALDELESKAQPAGRGTRVFPYSHVTVHIAQPGADRAAIDAVFAQLDTRLRERLREIRCELSAPLVTAVSVTDGLSGGEPVLRVECRNDVAATPAAAPVAAALHLRIVKGQCERAEYECNGGAVSIGRGAEPADAFGRMRRNEIAFLDVRDGISETVARAHARIAFDPALRAYLLFNESGSNPTFLLRGGRSLRVTPRDRRGVRLESGDHIQLGLAVVAVTVTTT